ncbi:hypothetical protein EDB92DRAFT_1943201 [Lactarius akahatsu]|uniref:Transcription activator of gluconeogenesis ERT1 n=1 Tax=Lactarius akahatsu TaxID=416441 RepID=A0AAD4LL04_9AGAM|nr:hypothetical protein EDB92DRAFT_1943201 [Lactarius akahatsu]
MSSVHSTLVPGPSSGSTSKLPLSTYTTSAKRRRPDPSTDSDNPSTGVGPIRNTRKDKDTPKKKKAARACIHCQRAHLTCDDSRPCQRCTKRGMADSCIEGHRKRAKYLLGDDELGALSPLPSELLKRQKTSTADNSSSPPVQAPPPRVPSVVDSFSPTDPLFNPAFDAPPFPFGSEAANLEYSILSAILGNPSPEGNPPSDSHSSSTPPPSTLPFTAPSEYATSWSSGPNGSLLPSEPSNFLTSPFTGIVHRPAPALPLSTDFLSQSYSSLDPSSSATSSSVHTPQDSSTSARQPVSDPSPSKSSLRPLTPRWPACTTDSALLELSGPKTAEEVYGSITKPYDYTEGYHFLMKVLPFRFEKNDILRIVRALAIFRPSLIALQMPLTEEDEIFVEKCVQRSVIELNKLISYSGTPTVVWRRTGEICLVGPEFCMLTEWSKEELLGTKKYIWELFENQSVVEYWENFATHAFENTAQSVYSHCVLLKPNGTPVPATFCFHIRRDLFDLPSLVIGA